MPMRALTRQAGSFFATAAARVKRKAEIPDVDLKAETVSDDSLVIYKPTTAPRGVVAERTGKASRGRGGPWPIWGSPRAGKRT
jgi:hypothetical protein